LLLGIGVLSTILRANLAHEFSRPDAPRGEALAPNRRSFRSSNAIVALLLLVMGVMSILPSPELALVLRMVETSWRSASILFSGALVVIILLAAAMTNAPLRTIMRLSLLVLLLNMAAALAVLQYGRSADGKLLHAVAAGRQDELSARLPGPWGQYVEKETRIAGQAP